MRTQKKHVRYAQRHEHVRKDVKRCFNVIIQQFRILSMSICSRYSCDIDAILLACAIMHNIVMEKEKDNDFVFSDLLESCTFNYGMEDYQEEEPVPVSPSDFKVMKSRHPFLSLGNMFSASAPCLYLVFLLGSQEPYSNSHPLTTPLPTSFNGTGIAPAKSQ